MDSLFIVVVIVFILVIVVLGAKRRWEFTKNLQKFADELNLIKGSSETGILYVGEFSGRALRVETRIDHHGKYNNPPRIRMSLSTNLPVSMYFKMTVRPYAENIVRVVGENVDLQKLFEIELNSKQLDSFDEEETIKLKLIESVKTLGSGSHLYFEVGGGQILLDHGTPMPGYDQLHWSFSTLNSLATFIESNTTKVP